MNDKTAVELAKLVIEHGTYTTDGGMTCHEITFGTGSVSVTYPSCTPDGLNGEPHPWRDTVALHVPGCATQHVILKPTNQLKGKE